MFENKWVFFNIWSPGGAVERAEEINNTSCASWDGSQCSGKPNLCKEWIFIYILFIYLTYFWRPKISLQSKKDEPKKNIEFEFYWGFDDIEKTKISPKQNKTKQSWNMIIIIIKAFKVFCHVAVVLYSFY